MQFFITFLEGVISFISPCMLPMLPVYVSYFAGRDGEGRGRVLPRAIAFVLGFTVVFTALGLFAGTLGTFLSAHRRTVNIVCGAVVILFGLSFMGIVPLPFFKGMKAGREIGSVLSAFIFGVVYSVSLTPCVGAFLGAALMMAGARGGALTGAALLLCYSLGLGLPFVISAVLLHRLGGAFGYIKEHYNVINTVCGLFLILVGAAMALGLLNRLSALLS